VRADDLLGIDVAAEVTTLCGTQLQGPWQVPAELVRLAVARGAARVEIDRIRGRFHFRFDGALATRDELRDLAEVFDSTAERSQRQEAISRIESAGLSALLWAAGLPGARLQLRTRSGGWSGRAEVRRNRFDLRIEETATGAPSTTLYWQCRGLGARRAVAWLRTALRFVPIPVTICGRTVERGFSGALYRMRIVEPLPGEIAVTATGEVPDLWLLVHGVLSARAVIPGYPAFSAVVEMSGRAGAGSSGDELRAAANPDLAAVIDEAARMLLLLVDRLPSADEPVRQRLTTLLLGFASLGLRRDEIAASPIVRVRDGAAERMETPAELARRAAHRGGVISAVEPGAGDAPVCQGLILRASTDERSRLAELLDIRIESLDRRRFPRAVLPRIMAGFRRGRRVVRGLAGASALAPHRLTSQEKRLLQTAAAAGVELGFCDGRAAIRSRGPVVLIGRRRREVEAAVTVVADGDEWLYPALLAVAGDGLEIPDETRERWRRAMMGGEE
jgi:hypothetical protein